MDRFFRGIGDRIRGTNSAEERTEAAPETRDEPDGFWSDFGTTDVAARAGSTSEGVTADASSTDASTDNDSVDAAASTENASEEPDEDASSDDAGTDNAVVDAAASTENASENQDEESSDTDDGGSEDNDSVTTDSDSDELLITVDGDDSTTLTGGVVADGSGTVTIGVGGSDSITVSDGSGTRYDETPGVDVNNDTDAGVDSGDQPVPDPVEAEPEEDDDTGQESGGSTGWDPIRSVDGIPGDLGSVSRADIVRETADDGGQQAGTIGQISPEDLRVNPEFASRADLSSYLSNSDDDDDDDDEQEVPKDYLIEKPNVELQRDPSLYPENPQPKAGEDLDVMGNVGTMSAEFLPSSTEGASTDLGTAQFGEMDGLWGVRSEESGIGGVQIDDPAETSASPAEFSMVMKGLDKQFVEEQPQDPGFMAGGMKMEAEVANILDDDVGLLNEVQGDASGQESAGSVPPPVAPAAPEYAGMSGPEMINEEVELVGLVEELGSDVFLKADDGGPAEAEGYTATDDLWREGSGEKLEFMTGLKMEDVGKDGIQAESGQETGSGWNPAPGSTYGTLDPVAEGKGAAEPEPVVVEGTAVAASDLAFTMPETSADASGDKESGLEGILTPIPEPDYSLGPAPNPPDPVDKDNYFDPTHKDVGLQDAQPMDMDPYNPATQYGDSNEWFEEQYQNRDAGDGDDGGDDDEVPG
jgi:hypothetical protein